jgi:hypothetical protein
MDAKCAVRDVRDAEVLASRQKILDTDRQQRPEWYLEGPASDIEVASTVRSGV